MKLYPPILVVVTALLSPFAGVDPAGNLPVNVASNAKADVFRFVPAFAVTVPEIGTAVPEPTPCTETTCVEGVPAVPGALPAIVAVSTPTAIRCVFVPTAPVPVPVITPVNDGVKN